ncbi:MAG: nicotinate-nucleotide adenylyltransferase [Verrucomicrobia bacterium]|nr:MAG: nicotinate-nucleotide adenylyltransferase [Verrucomicrobiota bacterium]PYK49246.1 MAG: nicotinate-nucleotide adenylyltransferase [Verrucomicrobiota bacterium]
MEIGTDRKALQINLDPAKYGTFAEIGAGQEVARRFFRIGGAAGTIAKTMSAYDMTFSDAIYGPADRYVSRVRLQTMLDHEYNLLIERLDAKFGAEKTFFVFADTVAARSFKQRSESHGWLGMRFQSEPRAQPSQIIIHVRLLDQTNVEQQEALGVIGVNLLYGAFYHRQPEKLISSLHENLDSGRIEVDMIKFSGPVFQSVDNRLMSLQLVSQGLTNAVMFKADGETVQPAEVFYKKAILVERGNFRPVTYATNDMLDGACRVFMKHCDCSEDEVVVLMEMTLENLLADGQVDHADFLARADILRALGRTVLISKFGEYYRLAGYLFRYTNRAIGLVMGVPSLMEIFNEKYYTNLEGGILEALGRMFKGGLKLYVYPMIDETSGKLVSATQIAVARNLRSLFQYLIDNQYVQEIADYHPEYLRIHPPDVLARLQSGDGSWERMVPPEVVHIIKKREFFGYRRSIAA